MGRRVVTAHFGCLFVMSHPSREFVYQSFPIYCSIYIYFPFHFFFGKINKLKFDLLDNKGLTMEVCENCYHYYKRIKHQKWKWKRKEKNIRGKREQFCILTYLAKCQLSWNILLKVRCGKKVHRFVFIRLQSYTYLLGFWDGHSCQFWFLSVSHFPEVLISALNISASVHILGLKKGCYEILGAFSADLSQHSLCSFA